MVVILQKAQQLRLPANNKSNKGQPVKKVALYPNLQQLLFYEKNIKFLYLIYRFGNDGLQ